jgi:hypothetical protein
MWKKLLPLVCCIDSDQPSHYILTFIILANHTTKETADMCWRVVAFLCTPAHRIAIFLAAQLYPIHQRLAKFADGRSVHTTTTTYSVRALELVQADKDLLDFLESLFHDW